MKRTQTDAWLMAWPGLDQSVKWRDDLVYTVHGKMFAVLVIRGQRAGRVAFKAEPERFLELTARPGIEPAPYLARHHWVSVIDDLALDKSEWPELLRHAYELVRAKLPKRVREALQSAD